MLVFPEKPSLSVIKAIYHIIATTTCHKFYENLSVFKMLKNDIFNTEFEVGQADNAGFFKKNLVYL